ncbi:hypothetical protein RRF57_001182 [Xylaria bambusicola]|uniref:Uncharacterized protein n=1 Tax=Xylaria bambusicola TaxID=326684 RepID=A0AAN7UGX8_9PEZI
MVIARNGADSVSVDIKAFTEFASSVLLTTLNRQPMIFANLVSISMLCSWPGSDMTVSPFSSLALERQRFTKGHNGMAVCTNPSGESWRNSSLTTAYVEVVNTVSNVSYVKAIARFPTRFPATELPTLIISPATSIREPAENDGQSEAKIWISTWSSLKVTSSWSSNSKTKCPSSVLVVNLNGPDSGVL